MTYTAWLLNPDIEYAFLDWKHETSLADEQFYMRAIGHSNIKLDWQKHFDGLFYIKEMQPAHRIEKKIKDKSKYNNHIGNTDRFLTKPSKVAIFGNFS